MNDITDKFWGDIQKLIRDVVLPYQLSVMEDNVPGASKSHAIQNFRIAAGEAKGEFYGLIFQDSDLAKWLEAVAYSFVTHPDKKLEEKADELIELISRAQEPDGYLNTYFTIMHPERKWQSLHDCHELYSNGHMIEAAVAYYQATGKDRFLNIMKKTADLICSRFGVDKIRGIPGHQEIELALLRLYKVTGNKEYFNTALYFINERGKDPSYFEEEAKARDWYYWSQNEDRQYAQNHKPVREQFTAVGHSVRAVYMYTAMAQLALETNDKELLNACNMLWDNITQKQMYITGGIGSTVHGEAFSIDYDLPNDTTYSETCASIAMCFFARSMLDIKASGEYSDIMERMLYNTVLASMQLDGKQFFYVNPLEVIPGKSGVIKTHKHTLPERPKWFACACCPPNVSRLILSLGKYAWGEADNTVYAHMFVGGFARFNVSEGVNIDCVSNYPFGGNVSYTVEPETKSAEFIFAIHIPQWCKNVKYSLNGYETFVTVTDGYAYITRNWKSGDKVELTFDLPVMRIYSNLSVSGNAGKVCLQRGPLVYCFEQADNEAPLAAIRLPADSKIKASVETDGVLKNIITLEMNGLKETGNSSLYTEEKPKAEPVRLKAIPYYTWGNRTLGEMCVWIRE